MTKPLNHICEYKPCSKEFVRKPKHKRFCTSLCRQKSRDKRLKKHNRRNRVVRNTVSTYLRFDKKKGREGNVTKDFLLKVLSMPCAYCGHSSTGLDRVDNKKGHTIDNVVPCCKECNIGRMDNFTHEEMKIIGQSIKLVKDNRIPKMKIV